MNPYHWRRHNPQVEIPRSQVGPVVEELLSGGNAVLLAGRGMGKSVFLRQVRRRLAQRPDVRVVLLPEPPAELSVAGCLETLAAEIGVPEARSIRQLIRDYLDQDGAAPHLVLLYDEFDRYGRPRGGASDPPGRDFFNDLESVGRDYPALGVMAAGSIGVFVFRDALGSSFLARAEQVRVPPFDPAQIEALARPFAERGEPLASTVIQALGLASGGNPALVTYGLGALWSSPTPHEGTVAEIFAELPTRKREFLRDFQLSFADPRLSDAPQRVWELIRECGGEVSHADLKKACRRPNGLLRLNFADVLDLLQAVGLIRVSGSVQADPVTVAPVVSILTLPGPSPGVVEIGDRLRHDLDALLRRLHASSADLFRPGAAGGGKQLVPESVFAAFLNLGFEMLGWQAEREAQQAAGRTDLKLRWNRGPEVAVIEVKIWGRSDYRQVHRQLIDYWTAETTAGAVVMLTDAELANWPETYRRQCLPPDHLPVRSEEAVDSPVRAHITTTAATPDGMTAEVDHFLVRLPRRR